MKSQKGFTRVSTQTKVKIRLAVLGVWFLLELHQPVCDVGAAAINLEIGAPVSVLSVSGRDGTDQLTSPAGLMLRFNMISADSHVAATIVNKNSIGPENSLIASGTGIGLTWSIGQPFAISRTEPNGATFNFKPSSAKTFSFLVNNSKFDMTRAKPIPKDAVFIDEEPIQQFNYLGFEVNYGYHLLLGDSYFSSNLFFERSLSSPGQEISVNWVGISFAYQRSILKNF